MIANSETKGHEKCTSLMEEALTDRTGLRLISRITSPSVARPDQRNFPTLLPRNHAAFNIEPMQVFSR